MPITRICKQCHQPFTRELSKNGPYCSKPCSNRSRAVPEVPRFWSHVDKSGPCWLWTSATDRDGYGWFTRRNRKMVSAHRYMYELIYGPIPNGKQVCHHCDTPGCVTPAHLFLGSHNDNVADKVAKGRQVYGEYHPRSKLTDQAVREIRKALEQNVPMSTLAATYSVSPAAIWNVDKGKNWRHVS